jgi:hypothetical protein
MNEAHHSAANDPTLMGRDGVDGCKAILAAGGAASGQVRRAWHQQSGVARGGRLRPI